MMTAVTSRDYLKSEHCQALDSIQGFDFASRDKKMRTRYCDGI